MKVIFAAALAAALQLLVALLAACFALLAMYALRYLTGLGWWESFALIALGYGARVSASGAER